jgi:ABC-type nitrate/sulfonate/bicarbonate transport system ATPase subunit
VLLEVRINRKVYVSASGARLEVLGDIAFTLQEGDVAAFVGPSGCGKTTMLRILAGLDHAFEGAVKGAAPGRIGMVFQEPRLLPWRTAEANVRLAAPCASDAKLAELFSVLELAPYRAHYPGELSLGLARRVALARAFAVDPALLILDEPFVSLDQALAGRLRAELATLVDRRRVTTVLVTHDVEDAIWLADRIFLLAGRPARIATELAVPGRRGGRSAAQIAAMRQQIAAFVVPCAAGAP